MENPTADNHQDVEKCGYLQKFGQKGFPYLPQWKKRYCLLSKGKLFFYDKSDIQVGEKNCGLIDLKYFDHITEATSKDNKKYPNLFLITSKDRSFFYPGRYLLAADSTDEMQDWIEKIRNTIEFIKNNHKLINSDAIADISDKKSNSENDLVISSLEESQPPKLNDNHLLNLPSFSNKECDSNVRASSENGLPNLETTPLNSITRSRIRGPSGRRAPKNRHSLKHRTNSLLLDPDATKENQSSSCWPQQSIGFVGNNGQKLNHESYPTLAYFYSDEEDSSDDNGTESGMKSLPCMSLNSIPSPRSSVRFAEECLHSNSVSSPMEPGHTIRFSEDERVTYNSLGKSFGHVSGRSSPAMDALDDLLMNQSIQHVDLVEDPNSDGNDSDSNTFNAHQKTEECVTTTATCTFQNNFSEMKHLQQHVASIDMRTTALEQNNSNSVDAATEIENIKKEVHRLSSSVNFYTTEFGKIKLELADNFKKMEAAQRQSLEVVSQAKRAREEYECSKRNYDELICELFNYFSQIKDSMVQLEQTETKNHDTEIVSLESDGRKSVVKSREKTSHKNDSPNKLSAYQAFFHRPSSLLHGLASKSHIFSVGEKDNQKIVKQKKEKTIVKNSISKTENNIITNKMTDSKNKIKDNGVNLVNSPKLFKNQLKPSKTKNSKTQPSLSTEDIPMMDETVLSDENVIESNNSPKIKAGISHVSINVQAPSPNSDKKQLINSHLRNSELNINSVRGNIKSIDHDIPSKSSPSSPMLRNNLNYQSSPSKLNVQNNFGRQSSLPENYEYISQNNSGKASQRYGIIRQCSSPNIPSKRQSYSNNFPVLKQNSLGIVLEEGISRQSSLLSVPEERLIVDQTLPASISGSMSSFQLSPSSSGIIKDFSKLASKTESQGELVVSSSANQHLDTGVLPTVAEFYLGIDSATTSSLKKRQKVSKINLQI